MHLFENQKIEKVSTGFDINECEKTLDELWKSRYSFGLEDATRYRFNKNSRQQFISFTHSEGLKTGKYAGVIKLKDEVINIYPKIFKTNQNSKLAESDSDFSRYVFSHILWWMTYSERIRLPKSFSSYNTSDCDFLEILIYFFAYYTDELVNNYAFNDYQLQEDELSLVRGRIKFNDYISNIAKGNWHKIPCEYSEFQYNNLLNQIIRYVSKLLYPFTTEKRTKKLLDNILHQLDDVSDVNITIHDCDRVNLNPLFEEYLIVLDYCRMFISNSVVSSYNEDISVFSFLINTESIYEDFLFGFIKKHQNKLDIKSIKKQHGDSLANEKLSGAKCFGVKMDYLIIMNDDSQIIGDAKYKRIYREKSVDSNITNYGISNSDVFQMIAYSYRKDIEDVLLFYPTFFSQLDNPIFHEFNVLDSLDSPKIDLKAVTLNVINKNMKDFKGNKSINELFKHTEEELINQLKKML
jgi:5-methylcytosine-specific restriction enzyme subunit McrC